MPISAIFKHKVVILFSALALACLLFQGCGGESCPMFGSREAVVIINGQASIDIPSPVVLNGVHIGKVIEKGLDEQNRPFLRICLDKDYLDGLKRTTVFYIDSKSGGLACAVMENGPPLPEGDLTFIGFDSYAGYFAWKAEYVLKRSIDDLLKAIDEAIK